MYYDIITEPFAQMHMFGGDGSTWNHMMYGPLSGWAHPFGGIFMLLFFVVVGYLLFALLRRQTGGRPNTAVEILKARFARGEIDREEFGATLKSIK